jgi:hypothetical protein
MAMMEEERVYIEAKLRDRDSVEKALRDNVPRDLQYLVIEVAMVWDDQAFAEELCGKLSGHIDEYVLGNAILGLGHVARRFGSLAPDALSRIRAGLSDPSTWVRGHALTAASDATFFLGVSIPGYDPSMVYGPDGN